MRKLELLAPAKNLECGMAAIRHGADAVYIGASRFGARAAAGNTIDDIAQLCDYAHQYGAKVYVTVNTLIYEEELDATQQLILDLAKIGVDAILVQDMATLQIQRTAIETEGSAPMLHASTQMDTRSAEKVQWLQELGFSRAVLARELSLDEIRTIHQAVPEMELEVFVHGANCVSYSGVCYASQHCFNRSANRGACAQFCRMPFDLVDANGDTIEQNRHLLSLKDMNQIDNLEELAEAGASSFKIEGRLKDVDYVKNVVSAYSQRLDRLISEYPKLYCRASYGSVVYNFTPNLSKTFNRGYTSYFLHGRQRDIVSFDTPKALGEFVGRVKEIGRDSIVVAGTASFSNGDGLCFINGNRELEGFRVNRVVGNRLFPFRMPKELKSRIALYRNNDEAFEKILSADTAERRLPITMHFGLMEDGFSLSLSFQGNRYESVITTASTILFDHQIAKKPQTDNINRQLLKLGNTKFSCEKVEIEEGADQFFIPSSLLSDLRHQATESLGSAIEIHRKEKTASSMNKKNESDITHQVKTWHPEYKRFPYLYNVANHVARDFYDSCGLADVQPAMEVEPSDGEKLLMQCRHCLRFSLGYCVKHGGQKPTWREPLSLRLGDGRKFRVEFNCAECQMNIFSE